MARYRALERGQIPADEVRPSKRADASPNRRVLRMVEKGEEFDFYGKPGAWMEPIKGGGQTDQGGQGNHPPSRSTRGRQSGQTDQGGSQAPKSPEGGGAQDSQ